MKKNPHPIISREIAVELDRLYPGHGERWVVHQYLHSGNHFTSHYTSLADVLRFHPDAEVLINTDARARGYRTTH
jgi:hypothetical protein